MLEIIMDIVQIGLNIAIIALILRMKHDKTE